MAFEYELPDVGEGVAEGEVVAWHVDPGDHVEEDQVLAEIETDKAVVDLPSPVDGTIVELHAAEGDVVPVGSVVVTIDVDGEEPDEVEVEPEEAGGGAPAADASGGETGAVAGGEDTTAVDGDEPPVGDDQRVFAPPNVRRLARELGVDITAVEGSGPSGRITEADVRGAAEATAEPSAAEDGASTAADEPAATHGEDDTAATKASTGAVAVEGTADRNRTLAAPATRKVARELGVDLDQVPTEKTQDGEAFVEPEDVRAFAEARAGGAAESAAAGQGATGADARRRPSIRPPQASRHDRSEPNPTAGFGGPSASRWTSPRRPSRTRPTTTPPSWTTSSRRAGN
jgi:pyruvate dehydrogenase E2 component (dihydrolipoamide acetyltransferase)